MKKFLFLIPFIALMTACAPKPVDFREVLPKEGWKTYHDDVRGVTCWFFQHPTDALNHFGAGCVPDSQWKK